MKFASRRRRTARLAVLFALSVSLSTSPSAVRPASGQGPTIADLAVRELSAKIPLWVKEGNVPGAAAAIVDDKGILWQGVYGTTILGGDKAVTPETIFSIQSMSKSFTALTVLAAVQEGKLDLDAPVVKYLPDFRVNSRYEDAPEAKMTLRHLLAHRAGFTHEAPLGGNFDDRPHTFPEHVRSISDTWLRYPVGYRYSYSNLGIDLAGYIVEKVYGMPFHRVVKEKILNPLGMTSSTLDIDEIMKSDRRAVGHAFPMSDSDGGIPVIVPMIAAGGVYTNIRDMAEYLRFHMNKGLVEGRQILKRELIEEMHAVAFPERHQRSGYGLCMEKAVVGETYLLNHGGGGYGFITSMTIYPEIKLAVVTLSNSAASRLTGGRIMGVINPLIIKNRGQARPRPEQSDIDESKTVPAADPRLREIVGLYENNTKIGNKDGIFGISAGGRFYPLKMFADGGGLVGLFADYSELRIKPRRLDQPGTLIQLDRLTGAVVFNDFLKPEAGDDKPGPNKSEWRKYLGTYKALAWGRRPRATFKVAVANGYLTLGDERCREHLPGLFFTPSGEALDFRGAISTFRNIMLIRTD